jgi:5'-3' exonuclease
MNRCRHVTIGDAFTKAGMSLQILFRSLRKTYRDYKIDHIVFAVDNGSWRYGVYPQYKAKRKLDRTLLKESEVEENQIFYEVLKNLIVYLRDKTRCTVLDQKNIEGDDFVARWTQLHPNDEHIIISGDSDFVQLLAPNISIFDGVQERMLSIDGVRNTNGELMEFSIQPKDGKIKVGKVNGNFVAEPEWWRKALFVKLVRGDAGDGIFAAYPGVRYTGSSKREGILEVWQDRIECGYHWNNFFQQEWVKLIENGQSKRVKVIDEFHINESLIDLTKQPDDIKETMDEAIATAITKPLVKSVGLHFIRFCGENDLPALAKESSEHAVYLNAGYPIGV